MTLRRHRALVAAGLGVFALVLAAAPAVASSSVAPIIVRRVDTTALPRVTVDVETGSAVLTAGNVVLTEDGRRVPVSSVQSLTSAQIPRDTVLVVDTASSMNGAKMFATQVALKQLITAKPAADQMAIVAFGSTARTVQSFTSDQSTLDAAVNRLAVGGNAVLNDGVVLGANLLAAQSGVLPQLVIVADGNDAGSTATCRGR